MRILLLDIETSPNIGYFWGLFDQNINYDQVEEVSRTLCWSAKWLGDKEIYYMDERGQGGHRMMIEVIHGYLQNADVVVHFNGRKFDIPTLNKEFIKYKLPPPSPYKQVDLYRVCVSVFRFASNKLKSVIKELGIPGEKLKTEFKLWVDCMRGDERAWKYMRRYNMRDVRCLEQLYKRLLPWIPHHPNLGDGMACPKCQSKRTQQRGTAVAIHHVYQRYQCQACGSWFRGTKQLTKKNGERGVNL